MDLAINENGADRYDCCDEITCPYCGVELIDSINERAGTFSFQCRNCGKTFMYRRVIDVTYSSWREE